MLPGIKENDSANLSSFMPKTREDRMHSSCIYYSDALKRKARQLQAGPKIKIPEALKKYRKRKKMEKEDETVKEFPCMQKIFDRIKVMSFSPNKFKIDGFFGADKKFPKSRKSII